MHGLMGEWRRLMNSVIKLPSFLDSNKEGKLAQSTSFLKVTSMHTINMWHGSRTVLAGLNLDWACPMKFHPNFYTSSATPWKQKPVCIQAKKRHCIKDEDDRERGSMPEMESAGTFSFLHAISNPDYLKSLYTDSYMHSSSPSKILCWACRDWGMAGGVYHAGLGSVGVVLQHMISVHV